MSDYQDISTAPKNGKVIVVSDPECGDFIMSWNPLATNPVFCPGQVGMWEAIDKGATWGDGIDGKSGPTRWKEL